MNRFRSALDPVCLVAVALYVVAHFALRSHLPAGFWRDQFTDTLLIPAALPPMLWLNRRLGLRAHDGPPTWSEIAFYGVTWSIAAEVFAPKFFAHVTGDWRDIAAYAGGSLVAGLGWTLARQRALHHPLRENISRGRGRDHHGDHSHRRSRRDGRRRSGFDLLAPIYPLLEKLLAGPRLQRCRTTWVGQLAPCRRVLIAGVGHGPFLRDFLPRFPGAHLTCLDASSAMLATAQREARRAGLDLSRVEFVHAALPAWPPTAGTDPFDLIVTNFFLDCFAPDELTRVIAALDAAAAPEAHWLVADFSIPARGLARWRARAVHALMYAFFRRVTGLGAHHLTDPDARLTARGFTLARRSISEWGLLRADLWVRRPGLDSVSTQPVYP